MSESTFDPRQHTRTFRGKGGQVEYLDVRWRIKWLRDDAPASSIETELVQLVAGESAVFKATVVRVMDGEDGTTYERGRATGYGSETAKDFPDFIEKAECLEDCVEILTRSGFKHHSDLAIGEDVLAYNVATDQAEWTPLRRVVTYRDAQVVRVGNTRDFEVVCTPHHSWATARAYRLRDGHPPRKLTETRSLTTSHKVILSAVAPGGDCQLTPDEAAILGWLFTDGSIYRDGFGVIYQSKPETVAVIRKLVPAAHESVGTPTVRTFPTGRMSACLPQHRFRLSRAQLDPLFAKAGIACSADLPALATRLTQPARRAMLQTMMSADGDTRGYFGKQRKPGVFEAWRILATLEGHAVGQLRNAAVFPVQRLKKRRYVSASELTLSDAGRADVWCPTTDFGTWVARLPNGQITITGNTKAIGRALNALGYGAPDDGETGAAAAPHRAAPPASSAPPARNTTANAQARIAQGTVDPGSGEITDGLSPARAEEIRLLARGLRWGTAKLNQAVQDLTGAEQVRQLTGDRADYLIAHMTRMATMRDLLGRIGRSEPDIVKEVDRVTRLVVAGEHSSEDVDAIIAALEQ